MKRIAILLLLTLTPLAAFAQSYSALLSGAAEVPGPGDPDGVGLAVVTLDGTTLRYTVWTQNIGAPVAAHLHAGAAGVRGDVVVPFDHNLLFSGTTNVSADVANQIRSNPSGFYVNVHTGEFPDGAIRGQLAAGPTGEGTMTSFIPVVGKAPGQNNTQFVTDLRIVNNGSSTAHVQLDYFAQSLTGQTAPTATQTVTVAPGEQKVLNDVVGGALAVTGASVGGLKITSDQNITASARIINDQRAVGNGTAGFAVDSVENGQTSGTVMFLSSSADYRTNVGFFNPLSTPVTATFTARRSSDGSVLGTSTVNIAGFTQLQQSWFILIPAVSEANRTQDDFYITWTSSAPLFVYGAVTDNRTGDAVLNQ